MSAELVAAPEFVDTNVLVYSVDPADDPKHVEARRLVKWLMASGAICTSTQVLSELFVTASRKLRVPVPVAKLLEYMDQLAKWPVVATDYRLVREASELSISARISYWDALIVAAAARAGATTLYSEDLNPGQKLLGVEIVNPFRR